MSTNTVTLHRVLRAPPEAIPVEMCYLGWQESLAHLTQLVKPNIPGYAPIPPPPTHPSGEPT